MSQHDLARVVPATIRLEALLRAGNVSPRLFEALCFAIQKLTAERQPGTR